MTTLNGQYVTLPRLDPKSHSGDLWHSMGGADNDGLWRYMADGPFPDQASFDRSLLSKAKSEDPLFHAVLDTASGRAAGYASFLRMEPVHRVVEIGNIVFSPRLQRTRGATEAVYLMLRHVFEGLEYRRCEWKCNALK